MAIAFEIVTVILIGLVLCVQRPGLHTKKYAREHNCEEVRKQKLLAARQDEVTYLNLHPVLKFMLKRSLVFYVAGLALVIVTASSSSSIKDALTAVGISVQSLATLSFVSVGLVLSVRAWRAMRSVPEG